MHPLTIVPELRAGITAEQRAEWLSSDAVAWANESPRSRAIPTSAIASRSVTRAGTQADNRQLDDGEPEKMVVVHHMPIWTGTHRS